MRILPGIPLKSLQDLERKKELTSCESVLNSQRGEVPLDNLFLDMALGVLFRTVWVGYVGDRVDIFSWFRCLRWGCARDWVRLRCDNAQRILKLSLPYLPLWKSTQSNSVIKAVTQSDRNHRKYLYRMVCYVESVETRPPFLWVSCQSPEIDGSTGTLLFWYLALLCST